MGKNTVQAKQIVKRWYANFKHVNDSEQCLQLFQHNKKEFLCKYVTMAETWIHHFTPESNQQSVEWTAAGENRQKKPKMQA